MNLVPGPDNDRDSPSGLMLAPVVPAGSKVQLRIRVTAALGKRPCCGGIRISILLR